MERRVLSSSQSLAAMYVVPYLQILLTPAVFGGLYLGWFGQAGAPAARLPLAVDARLAVLGFWLALTALQVWWGSRLKRVAVDDEMIYISDYFREVALPLSAIAEVRELRWLRLHPVIVELSGETPWGGTIWFMPKIRFFTPGFLSHPVVQELRDLAFAAQLARRAMPIPGDAAAFRKPSRG